MEIPHIPVQEAKKLTYGQLALAEWLVEKPGDRFVVRGLNIGYDSGLVFCEVDRTGPEPRVEEIGRCAHAETQEERDAATRKLAALVDRLGGTATIDPYAIARHKALVGMRSDAVGADGGHNNYQKFMIGVGKRDSRPASGRNEIYVAGQRSAAWWEAQGKALFEPRKLKRERERERVARQIVISTPCIVNAAFDPELTVKVPAGLSAGRENIRILRPTFFATVVKEGKDRLYLSDIRRIRPESDWGDKEGRVIEGREPNRYVDPKHVMVDGATLELASKLAEIDADHVESFHRAANRALEAALPALIDLHSRNLQAEAQREDMIREAISSFTPGR